MVRAKLITPKTRRLEQVVPTERGIRFSKDVGPDISRTFGAGIITFENCALKWSPVNNSDSAEVQGQACAVE